MVALRRQLPLAQRLESWKLSGPRQARASQRLEDVDSLEDALPACKTHGAGDYIIANAAGNVASIHIPNLRKGVLA